MTVTAPAASPEHLNEVMIDAIAAARPVGTSDPRVLDAIRAVPRHAFVPGASLADAYNPELAVITKRDTGGKSLSCASVPCLVGAMLGQLDVRDGHRVFEAGAGTGWNAALLATLAGPGGHVTSIDIDPEVSAQAAANLERAGFPGVDVATGDAGLAYRPGADGRCGLMSLSCWCCRSPRRLPEIVTSALAGWRLGVGPGEASTAAARGATAGWRWLAR
jgi:protein-L-isoaspartate(D-aspartate) O-methyltransferase